MELPSYTIRLCASLPEFSACLEMQREVWQFADLDITPLRSFVITKNSGGFTLGAFSSTDEKLLGFAHALAAFDEKNRPYYYSHMLAVDPVFQNSGLGLKLKFAQRDYALQHGIDLMVWTFDPLQSRNAHLNINKLGGVIRKYQDNYYGNHSTSQLHRGLDTDRLLVEWWLDSARVKSMAEFSSHGETLSPVAKVAIPYDLEEIKNQDLQAARNWQIQVREGFQNCLKNGLFCAGFERGTDEKPSQYLFFSDTR